MASGIVVSKISSVIEKRVKKRYHRAHEVLQEDERNCRRPAKKHDAHTRLADFTLPSAAELDERKERCEKRNTRAHRQIRLAHSSRQFRGIGRAIKMAHLEARIISAISVVSLEAQRQQSIRRVK